MATTRRKPWKKSNPRKRSGTSRELTAAQKRSAAARARKAGRRYPNLVDNMNAAKAAPKRKPRAKRRRKTAKRRTKDPHGGLTAAGRAAYRSSEGAQLKPGVRKAIDDMSPDDMRRKGSWAVRFYGRAGRLPPLLDDKGEPTRFALTAAAWGEPVPRTAAAARRIAAKGRRLLARYKQGRAEHRSRS